MKIYSRILQSIIVGSSIAAGALYADLPAFDGFEYTADSTLFPDPATTDGAGGIGWENRWTGSGTATVETTSTLVSFTDDDGNVYGGGNSVQFSGGSTQNAAGRAFLSSADTSGADVYFSYVVSITDGAATGYISSTPFFTVGILDNSFNVGDDNFSVINAGQLGARVEGNTTFEGTVLQYSTSYLVVGRLSGWDGDSYNTTTVWLNPNSDDIDNTSISTSNTATGGGGADGFRGVTFRTFNLGTHEFNIDDVQIGDSWDAVVIPEPASSSFAFGTVGLVAVMLLRRRN